MRVFPKRLDAAVTLARRGVLPPIRPDRFVRQALAVWRWGPSVATAYTAHAIAAPDQAAVIDDSRELSYHEVHLRTNALARGLSRLGVREGDSVGVLCPNGSGFVESVVASAKLGADVLLLNTSFAAAELSRVLARERPDAVIYDSEFEAMVAAATSESDPVRVVTGDATGTSYDRLEEIATKGDSSPLDPPEHESRTVILTSGTTGDPKGARLRRPDNIDPLAWLLKAVPLPARSTYHVCAPLFHAHGYGQFVTGAGLGCTLVLNRKFDAQGTLRLIERQRVAALAVVPVMLKRIMDLPEPTRRDYDTSSLEVVLSSGSALPGELARSFMEEFGPVLYNLYGSTEVAWATIATPDDMRSAPGTVGRPPPHTRVVVLDGDGKPLLPGETGRIFVGHEMLFEGYTDDSVPRALTSAAANDMLTAGDLGHLDEDGRLFVDCREDDMIVSGGENVYPGEVEDALAEHPDVEEIAAVGVEDEQFGERLVVFVVPRAGSGLSVDDVLSHARERLARYKQPREVELMSELPRNALGKVLKKELKRSRIG